MKNVTKTFNQSIDCSFLDKFNDIINANECFWRKVIKKEIDSKHYRYQYFNQLCTCMIRIRETSKYLEHFEFKQDNSFGQAFDFYEFINCLWIVYGCTEDLFKIFGLKLEVFLTNINCFQKSNMSKSNDIKFFKFIRSAATAHPSETTRYNNITKHKLEVYPYALWHTNSISSLLLNEGEISDIELLSWCSSTKCKYKRYYIYIDEFYKFINCVTKSIFNLISTANKIVEENIEKLRCKKIKKLKDFENYHNYICYLRKRLKKLSKNGEYPDGGLLLADHILDNKLIDIKFKKYIKQRIEKLVKQMLIDITKISFTDIFDELNLYDVIEKSSNQANYISEKFHDYLWQEAIYEINTGLFFPYRKDLYETPQHYAKYSVLLLERVYDVLYKENEVHEMMSYTDIYELTLQSIYFLQKREHK